MTIKWHILYSDCSVRPIIGTTFLCKNVPRYFGKFQRKSNVCIIQYDWVIALYIFILLVRNENFIIVKNIGVREELNDLSSFPMTQLQQITMK